MKKDSFPSLSIVIPLYNEEIRFAESLPILIQLIKRHPNWEIVLVNDGSIDMTKAIVSKAIVNWPMMRLVSYSGNKGKGNAVKEGVLKARHPWILITDIDFSTPLNQLEHFYPHLKDNTDNIIGTRKSQRAQVIKRQQFFREWCGKQFTLLANFWLNLQLSDFTCGFKVFKSDVAKELFSKQRIHRWGYDAEVLFLASHQNYSIVEVPVQWHNDARTKVNMVKDIGRSLEDLWMIRWNYWNNKYHLT